MNEENPLDAAEGCIRGCLITLPFWIILIVILVLMSLSCAVQTVPTQDKPRLSSISIKPTHSPTPTKTVETIGQVNIRVCPATNCEVLDVAEAGMKLTVIGDVRYTNDTVNCSVWRTVDWEGQTAYVCNRWVR